MSATLLSGQVTVNTDFRNTTASGWVFGGSSGSTSPYLTANTIDTPGDGWLRLTENSGNQATYALYDNQIFSVNAQIEVTMDYAFYNGSGADGITFFLVDGTVDASTFSPGAYGGSLGYAQRTGVDGLSGGYLGFGLDNYGNFSNGAEGRNGGLSSGGTLYPNRVAVRGPESSNYEFIAASAALETLSGGGQMDFPTVTSRPNQSGADYRSFKMVLDANNQLTVGMKFGASGSYTTVFTADLSSYDRPDTFKIGFTGSTGGSTEIHEIRNVAVTQTPYAADAFEWDNGAGTTNALTATNWVGDTVPGTNASILFGDKPLSGPQEVTLNANAQINSLTFDSAYNYTLDGTGTVTLGDPLLVGLPSINVNDYNGAQAQHHINVDLNVVEELRINNYSFSTLCLNGTMDTNGNDIDVNGSGAVNFNGDITGSGDLNKKGTGITTINNDNSDGSAWTGDLKINGGMVVVTTDGALGSTSGTTTVNNGGTLAFRAPTATGSVNYTKNESVTITGQGVSYGNEGYAGAIFNDGGNNSFNGTITLAGDAAIGSRDGVLTLNSSIGETGKSDLTKLGNGVVTINAVSNYTGDTIIEGGVLRITGASSNNLSGGFVTNDTSSDVGVLRFDGGVLEIGISNSFTRSVGTGEEQVMWSGDGGFSAYGGTRTVNLSGGTMTWNSGSFVPTGNALLLSSNYADSTIDFQNAINFGAGQREVRVANGSAAVDGKLSGNLTNGGLIKTGAGTLELTGSNNYSGATEIKGGALRGNVSGNSNLVLNGGVRELTGNFTGNLGTSGGQVRWAGDGGFSASGGNRTVTLNNSTSAVTWGSTGNFIGNGSTLVLGSQSADSTLIFNNDLNLGGGSREIKVVDGSAVTDARMNRVISNGSLTVVGDGNLAMRGNNTFSGSMTVKGAQVTLESGGRLNSISSLNVSEGGAFKLDNTGTYNGSRLSNSAGVNLNGGTLAFEGRTDKNNSTETVGAINLTGGGNTIDVINNRSDRYTRFTSASLNRSGAATVNFTNSAGSGTLSSSGSNPQMRFTSAPSTDDGILAYATVNGTSFAGVSSGYITETTGSTTSQSGWNATMNAAPSSDQTLTANRELNSLVLGSGIDVNLSTRTLDLNSGGLLSFGNTISTITNGTLTAGGPGGGELIAHVYGTGGLNISAVLANNGANEVSLTKTGDGTLTLSGSSANTFTGDVTVNDGTLALSKDAGVTAISGDIHVGDGRGTDILQLNNDEQIANTANVTLFGSKYGTGETILQFNGAGGAGLKETFGDLTIDGVAVIDFAGGNPCDANYLYLDDLLMSTPDSRLFIRNWIDFTDFLLVRNTSDINEVLSQVVFEGYGNASYWQEFDANYNVIRPVPEPSTYGAILMSIGLAGWFWRRRRRALTTAASR